MNVFHKTALQSLRRNRTRTLVTIVGVALSAALFTAVTSFGVSLLSYLTRGAIQRYGSWQVAFSGADTAFAAAQTPEQDPRIRQAAACDELGYARMEGGQNPDKPYWFLTGFTDAAFDQLPLTLLEGRPPETPGEVLVPAHALTNGGARVAVGDTLTLELGARMAGEIALGQDTPYRPDSETLTGAAVRRLTVVGLYQRPGFEPENAPGYTLISCADPADPAPFQTVFVTLRDPFRCRAYADGTGYPYRLNDEVLRFMGLSSDRLVTSLLLAMGAVVMAIILVGSVFLIYNAFHISLGERMRQIGVLASVGATPRQLRGMVRFEGLCIGAAGIPLGMALGLGAMAAVLALVGRSFRTIAYEGVPLTLVISPPALGLAAGISLLTILISAWLPARKAAATPVLDCIRQGGEVQVQAKTVRTGPLVGRLCGLEGTLALKNFRRNRRRYRSIVLSLVLSVVLFVTTHSFVLYLQQASRMAVVYTTYDIGVSADTDMTPAELGELYETLRPAAGAEGGICQQALLCQVRLPAGLVDPTYRAAAGWPDTGTLTLQMQLQLLDEETFASIAAGLGLDPAAFAGDAPQLLCCAKQPRQNNSQNQVEDFAELFTTDRPALTLQAPGSGETRDVTLQCADFVPPDILPALTPFSSTDYFLMAVAPFSARESLVGTAARPLSQGVSFTSENPAATAEAVTAALAGAGLADRCTVYNTRSMFQQNENMIFIANVFAAAFIAMISLIAVANVFNTISTNIRLRRRELAMLRSVGMSDRSFNRMMRFECAFYGLQALAVGLPLSLGCSALVWLSFRTGGAEEVAFTVPWGALAASTGSVLLVIFVTMMYAVGRLRRANIIDALREDMA